MSKKIKSTSVNLEEFLKIFEQEGKIKAGEGDFREEFEIMVMDPSFKPRDKTVMKLYLFDHFFFIVNGKTLLYELPNHQKVMKIDPTLVIKELQDLKYFDNLIKITN